MSYPIQIRKCTTLPDFRRCVEIQRAVWGESDLETEPYVTFVVANQTGGQVLGAFDGTTMVGFTMAIVGLRNNIPYLHSHMTGVLPDYRDRKIGRALKLFQREEALSRNIRRIEWTFDPLETRNAHFNFNRLGAIARHYIPNFYGVTTSPLHRGLPTDRLLAEWHLDSPRAIAAINNQPLDPPDNPDTAAIIRIPIPPVAPASCRPAQSKSSSSPVLSDSAPDSSESPLAPLQSRIRSEFLHWFSKNYAATSVHFTPTSADYLLHPYSNS
jgi:predicted GNAT superfamily acetyltransferase